MRDQNPAQSNVAQPETQKQIQGVSNAFSRADAIANNDIDNVLPNKAKETCNPEEIKSQEID